MAPLVGVTAIVLLVEVAGAPFPAVPPQLKLVAPGQVAVSVVDSPTLIASGEAVREHNGAGMAGSAGAGGLTVTVTTSLPEEP